MARIIDSNEKNIVGAKVREIRIAKGMTQEELAAIMGTSQAAVGMWETGARMPRADKLPKLAEVLGCSVADLFNTESA